MSDKYQDTKNKYLKEKVEEFKIRVPKGEKAVIQAQAKSKGKSLNAYVVDLIHADLENNQ
jgi:predicted HicB family RNase H-like nuclease